MRVKIECAHDEKNPGHAFGDKTSIKAQTSKYITLSKTQNNLAYKEKYRNCFKPFQYYFLTQIKT